MTIGVGSTGASGQAIVVVIVVVVVARCKKKHNPLERRRTLMQSVLEKNCKPGSGDNNRYIVL